MIEQKNLIPTALNTIRFLAADTVQKANSGHPGLPMGATALAYAIWMRHLRHNPRNPDWFNRDRFVLSGGHGGTLLYSLLHLTGYDLPLDEMKHYRQWGSMTPGHPECNMTPGVETTTGPLGQGFAIGVGMAIAEAQLAARFNRENHVIIDHYVYAIVTDGDLMEGISHEAASLAGHLQLGKLIYLYDDNHITIEGTTEITFTEDRAERFKAYGWQVLTVENGRDVEAIDKAIQEAKSDPRPSLILCRTIIGYGMPHKQNTPLAHGEPPGVEELQAAKVNLGWPLEPSFFIPDDVLDHFRQSIEVGAQEEKEWNQKYDRYCSQYPALAEELLRRIHGELPADWQSSFSLFPADDKGIATRISSGKVMNEIAQKVPELIGGSADLAPSNKTWLNGFPDFQAATPEGRNFHFGIREHAMGAIVNGLALHGGFIPFGATYLVFSDYMRAAIRISALSHIPSLWIFTHDSIGVGEDGPTHQPVEQITALRAMPGLLVIRPGDANEVAEAWKVILTHRHQPIALILSRQSIPTLDRSLYAPASGLAQGAYVLKEYGRGRPQIILMASGTELTLVLKAGAELAKEGIRVRVVSFPSWELFKAQDKAYQDAVLPPRVKARLAVEAGVSLGWEKWVGDKGSILSVERFGASAPGPVLFEKFGFTVENVIARVRELL
jgi:transketolase